MEICALTETLLLDEDGLYDPGHFNDRLVLGLKGTISQAELHMLRSRLQGGKLNKAKKGQLRFPLPVGFCFDEQGQTILDPDQQVRHVVQLLFRLFREHGSAYAVMRHFGQAQILFPKRAYGGAWDGKLIWGRLTHSRVLSILKNPAYAGAYVYGRYRSVKKLSKDGTIRTTFEEVTRRQEALHQAWRLRIERAHYEAHLAQRRYEAVDPENRLVAATLEGQWNAALERLQEAQKQYGAFQAKDPLILSAQQREALLELTQDLPQLWAAPSTEAKDKKRILRLLIKDITVERAPSSKQVVLHIRWRGGACEDLLCTVPARIQDRLRYGEDVVAQVRDLAKTHFDADIAEAFNKAGRRSATGKAFTVSMIQWIRHKHQIASPQLRRAEELTVEEVAAHFKVSLHVVYYWIARGYLEARRVKAGYPYWITLTAEKEEELHQRVQNSTKLAKVHREHS